MMNNKLFLLAGILLIVFSSCSTETVTTEDGYDFIELPDGSVIYMNNATKISYPHDFTNNRAVTLEGEAYFDVTPAEQPFTVATTEGIITVTGTAFNVEARYNSLAVEVEEGAVEIDAGKIKKVVKNGERAVKKAADKIEMSAAEGKFKEWLHQLDRNLKKTGIKIENGAKKAEQKIDKLINK